MNPPTGSSQSSMPVETKAETAPLLQTFRPESVYSKALWRLTPVFFTLGIVSFVDRTNISLGGESFRTDLGLSQKEYGRGVSLFFVTYILFQVPSNAILKQLGTPMWTGIILVGWGISASSMAFAKNATHFYIIRLVLGMFEAGAYPATYYYLALFFPQKLLSLPISLAMAGVPVGMALSGPLAGALLQMDGLLGWKGWRWLFFMEGPPAILLALYIFVFLPRTPETAKFLSEADRQVMIQDACVEADCETKVSSSYLLRTIVLNGRLLYMQLAFLVGGQIGYVVAFWMPQWISSMIYDGGSFSAEHEGQSSAEDDSKIALLTIIPYVTAMFTLFFVGWSSVRFKDNKYHAGVLAIATGLSGFALPYFSRINPALGFVPLTLLVASGAAVLGPVTAMQMSYMTDANKAFGVAWMNGFGNLCGLTGPFFTGIMVDNLNEYVSSIFVVSAGSILSGILYMTMKDDHHQPMAQHG